MAAKSQSRRGVAWRGAGEGGERDEYGVAESARKTERTEERERERGRRWKEGSEREMERSVRNTEGGWLGGRRWSGITE